MIQLHSKSCIFGLRFSFINVYISSNILSYRLWNTEASCAVRLFNHACSKETESLFIREVKHGKILNTLLAVSVPTCNIGLQLRAELLMQTMPILETVAGEAFSMLWTSNKSLQLGDMGMRSPLANVSVLLSSNTEFKFSIQMASTGPSKIRNMFSPVNN